MDYHPPKDNERPQPIFNTANYVKKEIKPRTTELGR